MHVRGVYARLPHQRPGACMTEHQSKISLPGDVAPGAVIRGSTESQHATATTSTQMNRNVYLSGSGPMGRCVGVRARRLWGHCRACVCSAVRQGQRWAAPQEMCTPWEREAGARVWPHVCVSGWGWCVCGRETSLEAEVRHTADQGYATYVRRCCPEWMHDIGT